MDHEDQLQDRAAMPHEKPSAAQQASRPPLPARLPMQPLQCMIWCSVANPPTDGDYKPVFALMQTQFLRVCGAEVDVLSKTDWCYTGQEEYESQVCAIKYELETAARDQEAAERHLVRAFCRYQVDRDCPTLFMEVTHPKTDDVSAFRTYHQGIPIMDFGIGHLGYDGSFKCNFRYTQHYQPDFEKHRIKRNYPRVTIEMDREKLCIDFSVANAGSHPVRAKLAGGVAETTEIHRLEIAFRDMSYYILVDERSDELVDLYFMNTNVPLQLWRTKRCCLTFRDVNYQSERWIRTCTLKSSIKDLERRLTRQILGNSSTFCLSLPRSGGSWDCPDPRDIVSALEHVCGFSVEYIRMSVDVVDVDPQTKSPYLGHGEETDLIDWNIAVLFHIGFRMHEQIRFARPGQEPDIFEMLVRDYASLDGPAYRRRQLENALSQTFDIMSSAGLDPHLLQVDRVLNFFLHEADRRSQEEFLPATCRMIKRILITPSRVVVLPPGLQHDNRIIREFDPRCAVSVSFQNEDASKFNDSSSRDYVFDAIGKRLLSGIEIAGKKYEYLACSASQLRDQGCWMYAEDSQGRSAHDIREWMGVLNDIKHAGRKLARMGQCFSDSVEVNINVSGFMAKGHYWPDIQNDKYVFSDGVGKISLDMLKEVCADSRVANLNGSMPSALQIRFGGCKGMLSLDPQLPGKRLVLRMSMFKFESAHTKLEVNKISAPTPLVMNRQVITLLSQVKGGIQDKVFIQLLCRMMHRYADALLEERVAVDKLGDAGFSCDFAKLHEAGFQFTRDIFFRRMLTVVTRSKIEGIRARGRIEIPHEYGRTLLGVLDEYAVLEYGEVFVQYSAKVNDPGKNPIVHEGTVVVGKMPGLFPGDIRKLTAVNVEELHHLVDVIVFPQKGPRPHPNEISGSDLDGDEYWVTWHPKLIFPGDNAPAADFRAGEKSMQDRPVRVHDMVNFMVDYAVLDKVGQIANAHLAWADLTDIHSNQCINIAQNHSHIVDFVKTGFLPDQVKGDNFRDLLPECYPDFMEKADHKRTYRSEKVLGQIYRITCKAMIAVTSEFDRSTDVELCRKVQNFEVQTAVDNRLLLETNENVNYRNYLPAAEKLYANYCDHVNRIMRRYGIETEEELIGNAIVAKSTTRNMYTRTEDRHDLDKLLQAKVEEIKRNTRREFDRELAERFQGDPPIHARLAKASACYFVAYNNAGRADIGKSAQKRSARRSFPWLFSDLLVQVLQRGENKNDILDNPCIEFLTDSIRHVTNPIGSKVLESNNKVRLKMRGYAMTQSLARVIHILLDWADKWGFIAEKSMVKMKASVFGKLIESLIESDDSHVKELLNADEGTLLLAFLRAITDLEEDQELPITPKTLQDLKVSALVAHYQLARHPDICMLTERYQSTGKRTVNIEHSTWVSQYKNHIAELKKEYLENFGVSCVFRPQKRGGILHIRGPALSVEEFYDYWISKSTETEWVRKKRNNEENMAFSCSDDEDPWSPDDKARWVREGLDVSNSRTESSDSLATDSTTSDVKKAGNEQELAQKMDTGENSELVNGAGDSPLVTLATTPVSLSEYYTASDGEQSETVSVTSANQGSASSHSDMADDLVESGEPTTPEWTENAFSNHHTSPPTGILVDLS